MANKWNIDFIVSHFNRDIVDKLELIGEFVESAAKLRCPVDTGNLRGSITHKVKRKELCVNIGTNVEYAPFIEFGSGEKRINQGFKGLGKSSGKSGGKAQPFLRPALYESKSAIRQIMRSK